ncbi:MAG: histidine kinase [Solobacterium sp.]|nr:histidine kinase [Solobacterium sp.]
MEVWLSHPIEVSMDLWTLIISLLICFFMIMQRLIFVRQNILYFFWFMMDAVFMVLQLESYRSEALMKIMPAVSLIFVIATIILLLVLACSRRGGIKKAFNLSVREWAYIGVNMFGIFFFSLTLLTLMDLFAAGEASGKALLRTMFGFLPALLNIIADLTYFSDYHERLRRSSPHMTYVFMIAVFIAMYLIILLKGTSYAGGLLTIGMCLSLLFSILSLSRSTAAPVPEPEAAPQENEKIEKILPKEDPKELNKLDEILDLKEEKKPEPAASVSAKATGNTTLLNLDPNLMNSTLNAVYYLIDSDPAKAKTAVDDLSGFMNGKLNMANTDHVIPFEKEMELVRKYLSIQEMRYDDVLHVNYDLKENGFFVPPLSVSTLVQHAAESIIERDLEQGELSIVSDKDDLCCKVLVSYSVKPDEHIEKTALYKVNPQLAEVKENLETYCRGAMEILSEPDRVILAMYVPMKVQED